MKAEAYVEVANLINEIRRCNRHIENSKIQMNDALETLNRLLKANNRDEMSFDDILKEERRSRRGGYSDYTEF